MKQFDSSIKNYLYFVYRLIHPVVDLMRVCTGMAGYVWYVRDILVYNSKSEKKIDFDTNLFPILDEKTTFTRFDAHYYYQQLWVFEHVLQVKPARHVDIASTYQLSGYISKIVPTTFIDYRPIDTKLKNLEITKGDILNLSFESISLPSVSCLHVIEHIGLGRYGDTIDPDGLIKACKELQRVVAKNGMLYVSTPIGKEALYFNAHRVSNPNTIISLFNELELVSFSTVGDDGEYMEDANIQDYTDCDYACGMFLFTRK